MAQPPRPSTPSPPPPRQQSSPPSHPAPSPPPPPPEKREEKDRDEDKASRPARAHEPGKVEHANPSLTPENALTLFKNGHRIAKQGDRPDKWMSMGRLADGTPVVQTPLTPEHEKEIESGEYYLAEGAKPEPEPSAETKA